MMTHDWKRLDRHGLLSEPGQPVLMSATIDKLDEYADRIAELEAKLSKAVDELKKVDEYLTRLQTPGTEPLNSVNSCNYKKGRGQYTAMVRNEAREYWASLGNTLAELTGGKDE